MGLVLTVVGAGLLSSLSVGREALGQAWQARRFTRAFEGRQIAEVEAAGREIDERLPRPTHRNPRPP